MKIPKNTEQKDSTRDNQSPSVMSGRHKAAPPPGCCPGVAWQREQVKQFSEVRAKLARHVQMIKLSGEGEKHNIPDKRNEALWCHLMLGGEVWNLVIKGREEEPEGEISKGKNEVVGEAPKLGFATAIPVYVCEQVLEYVVRHSLFQYTFVSCHYRYPG